MKDGGIHKQGECLFNIKIHLQEHMFGYIIEFPEVFLWAIESLCILM